MNRPDVTIVVSPRERFGQTRLTLETLFAATSPPFRLVYVDGGVPKSIRRWLESEAQSRRFRLLGDGSYLSPDRARNLGFEAVTTKYVVFLDNDVVVAPGWLDALLDCAEASGAWIVGPLYCADRPFHAVIHTAGGTAHIEEKDGTRRFIEQHLLLGKTVAEAARQLVRGPTEQVEFHCLLVRAETMRALGPLDARFCSVPEGQIDLCMKVRALGGEVWLAPDAIVTYDRPWPTGMRLSDVPYYLMRWSERRGRRGLEHFRRVWDLAPDDPYFTRQREFMQWQRSHALIPLVTRLHRLSPDRAQRLVEWIAGWLTAATERILRPTHADGW
jgi:GT2 family glycosyltransferase